MDFAVPAVHRVKIKENEKIDIYLDLVRELKKTGGHAVMLSVIGALEMVPKVLEKRLEESEIRGKINTIRPQYC